MSHPAIILPGGVEPASLPTRRPAPAVYDPAPHRNRGMAPCPELSEPLMNRVIATAVAFGMPRREAEEARTNPFVRTHVVTLATMCWDAAAGDVRARAALDRIRFAFDHSREVAEILDAREQPADSGELTRLMGLD